MKRWIWIVAGIVAAVTAVTALAGVEAPSRVVDRTFVCSPIAFGGVGDLDIFANPSRDDSFGRHFVALLEVASRPDSSLVFVRARSQAKHAGLAYEWPVEGRPGVYAHSSRCAPSRASVPLSSKGLPGPPIRWSKELDCSVRGRVLVRVRAVLDAPTEWRRADKSYVGARQAVLGASVAVRNQRNGEPIAFMQVGSEGQTWLSFSPRCN